MFEGFKNVFGGGNREEVKPVEEKNPDSGVVHEVATPQEAQRETAIMYENVKEPILSIIAHKQIRLEEAMFPENMKLVLEGLQEQGLATEADMHLPVVENDWKETVRHAVREQLAQEDEKRQGPKIA